jgi:hypothetical protein
MYEILRDYDEPDEGWDKGNEMLEKQILRAWEAIERHKNYIKVPCLGYNVTEEELARIKTKLAKGETHTFTPAGMGIGHILCKRRRAEWDILAKAEIAEFFGFNKLYMQPIDWD